MFSLGRTSRWFVPYAFVAAAVTLSCADDDSYRPRIADGLLGRRRAPKLRLRCGSCHNASGGIAPYDGPADFAGTDPAVASVNIAAYVVPGKASGLKDLSQSQ